VRRSCWRASGTAEYKGDRRIAFSIVTEEPNELVGPYHDRMLLALADDKGSP
jgi:putative SOS response-associated peptidase YedK